MKQVKKTVFAIIAALIGAGFASGQEINVFFYSYGIKGIIGLAVCSILMSYIIYKVLSIIKIMEVNNYKDLVYLIIENRTQKKYLNPSYIINVIVNLFLIISFFIMIAGFGAYFSQEMGINNYIGSGILAILCFLTLIGNNDKIIKINSFLIPILIIFIVVIGIINLTAINIPNAINKINQINKSGWLISCILYSSYNSIFLIPVIITLKKFIKQKRDIFATAIITGIIVFCLAIAIYSLLVRIDIDINNLEMPVIYVISTYFDKFKIIYALIILFSIYTTAISIGKSILDNVSKNKNNYKKIALLICIVAFLVSGIGFSNLVTYIYPIFGILGLTQIWALIRKSCK